MAIISIVVPVYNCEKFLERCVNSITNSTFIDFELILVDDGSTDNSGELCDYYAKKENRISVIHKQNEGPGSARNAGIEYVLQKNKSKYIFFVDSDDYIDKDCLGFLLKACIENNTKISICSKQDVTENFSHENVLGYSCKIITPEEIMCDYAEISASSWGKLYELELFKNIRYPIDMWIGEDTATIYKLLFQCQKLAFVEAGLYYYYCDNSSSLTHKLIPVNQRLMLKNVMIEQVNFFKENGYERAYRYKFEVLIAIMARALPLIRQGNFAKDFGKQFELELRRYVNAFCKEFKIPKMYILNKYLGFKHCNFVEKIEYFFYKILIKVKVFYRTLIKNRRICNGSKPN